MKSNLLENIRSVHADWLDEKISPETAMTFIGMYFAEESATQPPQDERSEWLQESSYRAGASAGFNLGVSEDHDGLERLKAAHAYPCPAASAPAQPTPPQPVAAEVERDAIESAARICERLVCERYEKGSSERKAWNEATIDSSEAIRALSGTA